MTKLDKPLRREVEIASKRYTLTIDPQGLQLKPKGHRHGLRLLWAEISNRDNERPSTRAPLAPLA